MNDLMRFWVLIGVLAMGTWSMRAFPIILHGRVERAPWLERLLKHVPVAALTALVVPGALYLHQGNTYAFSPARLAAASAAMLVAVRTKNVLATLVAGMTGLWVAQWAFAALGV